MAPSAFDQQALRPLGEWLEENGPPSAERLQALLRSLAVQVSALHEQSRIHGHLTRESVQVTSQGEPRLIFDPPGDAPAAFCLDEEACPPELRGLGAIHLTNDLAAASCEFARRGCANDARRIDIFQLAALAIDIATQASVHDYLRRPLVSAQVPAALRGVLDEMLGESTSRSIAHCGQLLAALDAIELAAPPADRPSDKISRPTADTAVREAPARRAPPPASHDPLPFERIGPFEVVARLGSGGMGDVFRGYDRSLDRYVAIKVLPAELARHEDFVTRFRAEAAAAAKVSSTGTSSRATFCWPSRGREPSWRTSAW